MSERVELNYLEMKAIADLCEDKVDELSQIRTATPDTTLEDWKIKQGFINKEVKMDGLTVEVKDVKDERVEFYENIRRKLNPIINEIEHTSCILEKKYDHKNTLPILSGKREDGSTS